MQLENISAIVTGGASGLGAATAQALIQRGVRVTAFDLRADLPQTPWQHTAWKRAKVAPDFHIIVATVRYSVPHQLVGRTVDVVSMPEGMWSQSVT